MERFVIDHLAVVSEQHHDNLEMVRRLHVCGHDAEVRPLQQHLTQELDRLPLRHVTVRPYETAVVSSKE